MPIIRSDGAQGGVFVETRLLEDESLSWAARGIYTYLAGAPTMSENSNYKRSFGVEGEVSNRRAAKVGSLVT